MAAGLAELLDWCLTLAAMQHTAGRRMQGFVPVPLLLSSGGEGDSAGRASSRKSGDHHLVRFWHPLPARFAISECSRSFDDFLPHLHHSMYSASISSRVVHQSDVSSCQTCTHHVPNVICALTPQVGAPTAVGTAPLSPQAAARPTTVRSRHHIPSPGPLTQSCCCWAPHVHAFHQHLLLVHNQPSANNVHAQGGRMHSKTAFIKPK